jgi:hypothetical protein
MGLDMYLSNKRYLSGYSNAEDRQRIDQINEAFGIEGDEDAEYGAKEVSFRVAYWRKANAIHAWFVKNVQDGRDECQESWVSREQLTELVETCKKVIEKPKLASQLLAPQGGFFFGSTDVDEWYLESVQSTITMIEKALAEPALKKGEFYYQASW